MLENLIFLELKRRGRDIYFYKGKNECDFIIRERSKIEEAIQVTERIVPGNEKREINGLIEVLEKFRLKKGLIITKDQEEERKIKAKSIKIIPAWKWLLGA